MGQQSSRKRERKRVERPRSETLEKLAEQRRFLERSAAAFDDGDEAEALRLAVSARVVVYDSKSSRSLLTQLKVGRRMRFMDTAAETYTVTEENGITTEKVLTFGSALAVLVMSSDGSKRYVPSLDETPNGAQWVLFDEWWRRPVMSINPGMMLLGQGAARWATRGNIVLWLANQDGGAHIDPALDAAYDEIKRGRDPARIDGEHLPMPVHVTMRQIAHELMTSLDALPRALLG